MLRQEGGGWGDEVRCGGWRKEQEVGWQTEAVAPFLWDSMAVGGSDQVTDNWI